MLSNSILSPLPVCHTPHLLSLSIPFSSIILTMSQHHHEEAWSWEPPMNLHHHPYQVEQPREHMFEKSLTPSDVGKLNRLVIPKQHAEKHFPLDSDSGEKDLLLSFEDETGEAWRFRYSYWSSSQSYVLTKGWSRYVKDKKLDAGDVVLFWRRRAGGGDRLYIGCRRQGGHESRPPAPTLAALDAEAPWSRLQCMAATGPPHPTSPGRSCSCLGSVQEDYLLHAAGDQREEIVKKVAVAPANSKRLRLFGVNLD